MLTWILGVGTFDETNTCLGATGQGFWQYNGNADYVAFGKRMQVSGYFSDQKAGRRDLNLSDNQLGLQTLETINAVMSERDLNSQVERVGNGLNENKITSTQTHIQYRVRPTTKS